MHLIYENIISTRERRRQSAALAGCRSAPAPLVFIYGVTPGEINFAASGFGLNSPSHYDARAAVNNGGGGLAAL